MAYGVVEQRNRTLMDMVRSMMAYSDLHLSFWGEVLHTVVYLLNHSPSKAVTATPYELWTGRKPSLRHLAVWGCSAQIRVPNQNVQNCSLKARQEFLLVILWNQKGTGFMTRKKINWWKAGMQFF